MICFISLAQVFEHLSNSDRPKKRATKGDSSNCLCQHHLLPRRPSFTANFSISQSSLWCLKNIEGGMTKFCTCIVLAIGTCVGRHKYGRYSPLLSSVWAGWQAARASISSFVSRDTPATGYTIQGSHPTTFSSKLKIQVNIFED